MTKDDVLEAVLENKNIDLIGKLRIAYKLGYDAGELAGEQKTLCSNCSLKEIYDKIAELEKGGDDDHE